MVEGVATTIPADLAIVRHPDFAAIEHSTKWVEDVLDLTGVGATAAPASDADDDEEKVRRDVDVEVNGKRFAVSVWVPASAAGRCRRGPAERRQPRRSRRRSGGGPGRRVRRHRRADAGHDREGRSSPRVTRSTPATPSVVLEAMKMENNITADGSGTVTDLKVAVGDSVGGGDIVATIE